MSRGRKGSFDRRQTDRHKAVHGRVARGWRGHAAVRRSRGLLRLRGHVADHFEIVDPDAGRTGPAVHVQQQNVDKGFAIVHLRSKLHPQEVNLPGQQMRNVLDPQLLPAADVGIAAAGDDRRYGPACVGIDGPRQDDPGGQLHARPVRLDPHAGHEVVDHPRPAHLVGEIDVRAAVSLQLQPLATAACVGVALPPSMCNDPVSGVAAGVPPGRLRAFEALVPRGRRLRIRDDGHCS